MRAFLYIFLIALFPIALAGQSAEDEVIRMKQQENLTEESSPEEPDSNAGAWDFSVGTSYSYISGFGSGMMFYAAPAYTLPLNNRWALHGGLIASRYQGLHPTFSEESGFAPAFSSLALFAAASYRMNERLVFHGTGVKQILSAPVTPFTPYPMDNLSLGATYRLGKNITIGASIHMRQGRNYYAPHHGGMFQSPYFW